jgi:chitodextrinase
MAGESLMPGEEQDVPEWDAETVYHVGDAVQRNGSAYVARYYTTGDDPETNHEPDDGPAQGKPWQAA